ncbi:MAG: methyltransferase domain-containing protein [Elusimicrobia bacterium]|nr:methyltransferase domain-containing protein [Elusimicrobiota bacterium]
MSFSKPLPRISGCRRDILAAARLFMESRVLLTAWELGVFTALGRGARTAAQVARTARADPRAMDRLLDALVSVGLARKSGRIFSNSPSAARYLVAGRPAYIGSLGHMASLWESWSTLTQAVRAGRSVLKDDMPRRGKEFFVPFIAAMHERSSLQGPSFARALPLAGVRRLLDVGGGSGAYSIAFARAHPALRATVFDLPQVVPLARGYIRAAGLQDRVEARVGDYDRNPLPDGYDLVFLSHILHSNSPARNRRLLRKCARSLNPGGLVVIQEFLVDEDRTGPQFAALFALNMLVGTPAGDAYTEREIGSWLKGARLRGIRRKDTAFDSALLIARR